MRDVLHWLPTSQRMQYCVIALSALVSRSVLHCSYLFDLCCPRSVLGGRRVLRSVARGELLVPRARLAIMQRSAISVVSAIQHAVVFHLSCVLYWWLIPFQILHLSEAFLLWL